MGPYQRYGRASADPSNARARHPMQKCQLVGTWSVLYRRQCPKKLSESFASPMCNLPVGVRSCNVRKVRICGCQKFSQYYTESATVGERQRRRAVSAGDRKTGGGDHAERKGKMKMLLEKLSGSLTRTDESTRRKC